MPRVVYIRTDAGINRFVHQLLLVVVMNGIFTFGVGFRLFKSSAYYNHTKRFETVCNYRPRINSSFGMCIPCSEYISYAHNCFFLIGRTSTSKCERISDYFILISALYIQCVSLYSPSFIYPDLTATEVEFIKLKTLHSQVIFQEIYQVL